MGLLWAFEKVELQKFIAKTQKPNYSLAAAADASVKFLSRP